MHDEITTIHCGPATFLCEVGYGHVCLEDEVTETPWERPTHGADCSCRACADYAEQMFGQQIAELTLLEKIGPPDFPQDDFGKELEAIYNLHTTKRSDYTGGSKDRLANYRFSSSMAGLPIERGMLMRLGEKLYRLKSCFEKGGETAVADETLADTCRDIAVIAVLMRLSLSGAEGYAG